MKFYFFGVISEHFRPFPILNFGLYHFASQPFNYSEYTQSCECGCAGPMHMGPLLPSICEGGVVFPPAGVYTARD